MERYYISDGAGSYMKKCGDYYEPTNDIGQAEKWVTQNKAENILKNMNKNLRGRYKVESVPIELEPLNMSDTLKSIEEIVAQVNLMRANINERFDIVNEEYSSIDKKISDINHYIELYGDSLNAYEGWICFNMLKDAYKERRKIKDELALLSEIHRDVVTNDTVRAARTLIKNLGTRRYKPRVLNYLFEEKEKQRKKRERKVR